MLADAEGTADGQSFSGRLIEEAFSVLSMMDTMDEVDLLYFKPVDITT
jgi:hypothetical protein